MYLKNFVYLVLPPDINPFFLFFIFTLPNGREPRLPMSLDFPFDFLEGDMSIDNDHIQPVQLASEFLDGIFHRNCFSRALLFFFFPNDRPLGSLLRLILYPSCCIDLAHLGAHNNTSIRIQIYLGVSLEIPKPN